jgi:hypothetical protein
LRAEQFSFYPLLYDPNVAKRNESAAWCGVKRSKLVYLASNTIEQDF